MLSSEVFQLADPLYRQPLLVVALVQALLLAHCHQDEAWTAYAH